MLISFVLLMKQLYEKGYEKLLKTVCLEEDIV